MIRRLARRVLGRVRSNRTSTTPREPVSAPPPPADPVADAEDLARLDAGAQEIVERVGAGEPVVMLDVRDATAGSIEGALHIPLGELPERWVEVKDCDEIVCFSDKGERSREAARLLRERGVFNATSLEGGLEAWRSFGGAIA